LCARIATKLEVSLAGVFPICTEQLGKQKIVHIGFLKYITVISTSDIAVSHPFSLVIMVCRLWIHSFDLKLKWQSVDFHFLMTPRIKIA
jgi:hypothetical protein